MQITEVLTVETTPCKAEIRHYTSPVMNTSQTHECVVDIPSNASRFVLRPQDEIPVFYVLKLLQEVKSLR